MDFLKFPEATTHRIHKLVERLDAERYTRVATAQLYCHYMGETRISLDEAKQYEAEQWEGLRHWGKLWDQAWFRVVLPADAGGCYLYWPDQSEAIVHVDGKPAFGFDPAHKYFEIPEGVSEVWIQSRCIQSAIWHPAASGLDREGSRMTPPIIHRRDPLKWKLFHDLVVLRDHLRHRYAEKETPNRNFDKGSGNYPSYREIDACDRILIGRLVDIADAVDADDLKSASGKLDALYKDFAGAGQMFRAVRTGHCHIDLVWLWTELIGEEKAVHSFANVDYLMRRYPELRFAYSQPASYVSVSKNAPDLYRRVRGHIDAGRWEPVGGLWIESDTHMPCGEALSRSFALGQSWFRKELGKASEVLWLPDTFGLSGALPSIAAQHGVRYFFGNKPTWNRFNTFERTSFCWQGADGNGLLAHISPEDIQSYNGNGDYREVSENARKHYEAHIHNEVLLPTGFGDGGGGPTEDMCEYARRTENLYGLPANRWDRIDAFFAGLEAVGDKLPVHRGELYLEAHRGVTTTNRQLKLAYRQAESALQLWEAARVLQGSGPVPIEPWQRVSFAQFHDCVTGAAVYEVTSCFTTELRAIGTQARDSAAGELSGSGERLFNPLPMPQRSTRNIGNRLETVTVPPLSVVDPSTLEGTTVDAATADASTRILRNATVSARFNNCGEITELTIGGASIAIREPLGQLALSTDRNPQFPAWDVDEAAVRLSRRATDEAHRIRTETDENGSASIIFERHLPAVGEFTLIYRLTPEADNLHLIIELDFQAERKLLKLQFPTAYMGRYARYGAAFGSVLRPQIKNSNEDIPQWEVPGSRWAVVSNDDQSDGFWVVTDACYGFSCDEGKLGVSLLRTVPYTGEESHLCVTNSIRRATDRPHFIDLGKAQFELRIGRFDPKANVGSMPASQAELLAQPLQQCGAPSANAGLLSIQGGNSVTPTWAMPHDDGSWTLRLHETLGRSGTLQLELADGWTLEKTQLDGSHAEKATPDAVVYQPFEILSLRFLKS